MIDRAGFVPWQLRVVDGPKAVHVAAILAGPTRVQPLRLAGDQIMIAGEPRTVELDRGPNLNDLQLTPEGQAIVVERPLVRGERGDGAVPAGAVVHAVLGFDIEVVVVVGLRRGARGRVLLAAADGKIVEWSDSVTDNTPGTVNPNSARGNYVMIQHCEGEFTCYYHLQRGSLQVKLGDSIKRGQPLAKCGNSGFSTQPHLHFALLDVREDWERALCLIAGSIEIPMGTLPTSLDRIDPDRPVVALCHHGVRSLRVAAWLRHQGFAQAVSLAGGIDAWSIFVDPSVPRY